MLAGVRGFNGRQRPGDCRSTTQNSIIGGGISDSDTLDYLARLFGDQEITQLSATADQHGRPSRPRTWSAKASPTAPSWSTATSHPHDYDCGGGLWIGVSLAWSRPGPDIATPIAPGLPAPALPPASLAGGVVERDRL